MPGMRFTIGINRYFNAGPAVLRTTLVSVAAPGETAYTAMPEGSRWCDAATHQAMMSFASAYALLGTYFMVKGEGRVVRPREARVGLLIMNYSVIYWCDGHCPWSFKLNVSQCR